MTPRCDDLDAANVAKIALSPRQLMADVFVLYVKTKGFRWHMTGSNFRDYHLLLDEHSDQLCAMTDVIAERARKLGQTTLESIGDIVRHRRLSDEESEGLAPEGMLGELLADNQALTGFLF